jgi:hypothetical protein
MKHLVQFSTGLSSAFAREVVNELGCEWVRLTDGRTPMQVGLDRKCVPSNRMPVCSQELKRRVLRWYLDGNYDPASDVVYIGYDWSEPQRIASAQRFWAPWTMAAPLAEPPYAPPLQDLFRSRGIEPPALYAYGLPHANCGGLCVRGGQAQWELMLQVDRCGYLEWEREEEAIRAALGKDVSILKDRAGTVTSRSWAGKPLPLRVFREGIEQQPGMFDQDDWGACGCDMDGDGEALQPALAGMRVPKVERWDGSGWAPLPAIAA